jgi:hypothetical protein
MEKRPSKEQMAVFKKNANDMSLSAEVRAKFQAIVDKFENVGEAVVDAVEGKKVRKPRTPKAYKTLPKPKMVALVTTTIEGEKQIKNTLKKLGYDPKEVDKLTSNEAFAIFQEVKDKIPSKAKVERKPRATKQTADDIEMAKAEIKKRTGKTEEECESIIEQYKALRTKSQERKKKEAEASKSNVARINKLKDDNKVIEGTTEKTADAVIESTTKDVAEKIEKQIEVVEKKAETEAKKEVEKEMPKVSATEKKKEVEKKVEEKVKAKTKTIVKRVVIDTSALLTSIAESLGKFDKDSQKEFLIKLRSDIDKLLAKYSYGGMTDGATQIMNIQQSNLSSSSVNPTMFSEGGGVGKLPNNLKKRLDNVNKNITKYNGRPLTEDEAIMWNVYHNSQSGFDAGMKALDISNARDYHYQSKRLFENIGDALIDISRKMTGVEYDNYDFRGSSDEENLRTYNEKYKGNKFSEGGGVKGRQKDDYNKLVGSIDNEYYFVDYIFNDADGFKGATGTIVMPVSKEYYDYATSEQGILERYMDAMGEDEWLNTLGLDRDDFEDEDEMIKAIEDGIYDLYRVGELNPFEEVNYKLEEQMRELPEFSDSDEYPLFETIGGGRIFGKSIKFDKIYDQELYDKIRKIEEFGKGGSIKDVIVYDNGGESLDRYTIFTPDGSVYGMSESGGGFNQYLGDDTEVEKGSHLGKRLKSVPKSIEKAVMQRMNDSYSNGGGVEENLSGVAYYITQSSAKENFDFLSDYFFDSKNAFERMLGGAIQEFYFNINVENQWNIVPAIYEQMAQEGVGKNEGAIQIIGFDIDSYYFNSELPYDTQDEDYYEDEDEFAKGGMTEHGLRLGDKIVKDFGDEEIAVRDKDNKRHFVNLDKGNRGEAFSNGGGVGKLSKEQALKMAINMGVDFEKDFHAQSYGNELSELAKKVGYRKSSSASGSLGRQFFYHLQKIYDKKKFGNGGGVEGKKYKVINKRDKNYGEVGVNVYEWKKDKSGVLYTSLQFPNGSVSTYSTREVEPFEHYDNRFSKGGGVNTGRSWKLDRARHNKSENYEVPMNRRKKAHGGTIEERMRMRRGM